LTVNDVGVVREVTKGRPIPQSACGSADYFLVGTASPSHDTEHNNAVASQEVLQRHMQKKLFCPQTGRVMLFLSSQGGTHHQSRRKSNAKS
jgi:hypothetical protein